MEQLPVSETREFRQDSVSPARNDASLPCKGHLRKLFDCRTMRAVSRHHVIYSQGESPHTVCLICSGMVKLTRTEADGTRAILGLRRKGWMLGAVSLALGVPYETTAETITRSRLCFVPAETFQRMMDTSVDFSRWFAMTVSSGMRSSMLSISERSCLSGRARLEKFLRELVRTQNGADRQRPAKIQMILKNWEVAQLLALTPQHLCRLIRQMEKEGVLLRRKGWLLLPDPEKLWNPGTA